jgi:AmmeMemoRadiSam system protein B
MTGPLVLGPAVAGSWYPADRAVLARTVDDLLARAEPGPMSSERIFALIEPHAGFVYSGGVAARGFREVRGRSYSRVVVLGPSHYEAFRGAAVPDAGAYRTPLGDIALDHEALEALARCPSFKVANRPFGPEHSLEAELPLLHRCLRPGWRLVPVLLGSGTRGALAAAVANGLGPWVDASTLIVVSSDFTHYGPRFAYVPFTEDVPARIRELDMGAVRHVEAKDADGFESYVNETGATVCGRDAISVLLRLAPSEVEARLTAYDTSGNITGDWEHSVSYAALAFHERVAAS